MQVTTLAGAARSGCSQVSTRCCNSRMTAFASAALSGSWQAICNACRLYQFSAISAFLHHADFGHCLSYVFNEKMIKMPRFRAVVGNQFVLPALAVSIVFDDISEQGSNAGVRCRLNVE